MKTPNIALFVLVPFLGIASSCEKKGPAEKVGEKIDKTVDDIKDTVDPKGPMEKAGEKIDETLEK